MSTTEVCQLFVYGSLRSGFKSPAYEYISQYFELISEGKVKGRLYDMGEYPAAKPSDGESFIIGELYTAKHPSEFDWAIGQLDDYEGTNSDTTQTSLYQRRMADVFVGDKIVPAWVYWYNGDVNGKPEIASGDLLEYIRNRK